MALNRIVAPLMALVILTGAFLFPALAYGSTGAAPVVTATLEGDTLHIEVKGGAAGAPAVYIDDHRIKEMAKGKADVKLKDYAGDGKTVAVYAVDSAGSRSEAVTLPNPYYQAPAPSSAPSVSAPAVSTPQAPSESPPPVPSNTSGAAVQDDPVSGENAPTTESAIPAIPSAFTPDGTGTVLDTATDADGKEFFTITTGAGNVFYLIVDRQRTDGGVYFLNAVTEADLMALAEKTEENVTGIAFPTPEEPAEPEETPASEQEPEPEKGSGASAGSLMFIIIAVIIIGGVAYYIKIFRPKRQGAADDMDDDGWDEMYGDSKEPDDESEGYLPEDESAGYLPDDDGSGWLPEDEE